jgi:hypothetical protein
MNLYNFLIEVVLSHLKRELAVGQHKRSVAGRLPGTASLIPAYDWENPVMYCSQLGDLCG